MKNLLLFRDKTSGVETGTLENVLSGSPTTKTWNISSHEEDRLLTGVWEATPGSWSASYDEWEYCHIVSGIAHLIDADGTRTRVGPGDAFVIEPGFHGEWEVIETITKHYVILLPR